MAAGALMSYATNLADAYRQAGVYSGKILGGARPAELPVVQSAKFELLINLKIAKSLGLTFPPSLAARTQQAMPVIGFLRNSLPVGSGHLLSALRQGLNDGGI